MRNDAEKEIARAAAITFAEYGRNYLTIHGAKLVELLEGAGYLMPSDPASGLVGKVAEKD